MIRKTLGAAFIAGSALTIYNTDTVKPIVDDAVATTAQNIDISREVSQNKEILQLGGGVLGLMLGVSMIAGAARRRLKSQHTIHPDVDKELNRKLSVESDLISEKLGEQITNAIKGVKSSNADVAESLREFATKMQSVDKRLAGELSVDISALEKASSEMGSVEGASQRVLEILEKIENSANAHIAINTPEGAIAKYAEKKTNYEDAYKQLETVINKATSEGRLYYKNYPNRMTGMIGEAVKLNRTVLEEFANGTDYSTSAQNISRVSEEMTTAIRDQILWLQKQMNNRSYMRAINEAAFALTKAADEYLSAHYEVKPTQQIPIMYQDEINLADFCDKQDIAANDIEVNEDGMIEVPGYGAIPANPAPQFD